MKYISATDGQIQVNDLHGSDFFIGLSEREGVDTVAFVLSLVNDDLRAAFGALAAGTGHKEVINEGHAAGHWEIEPSAAGGAWIENRSHDFATKNIGRHLTSVMQLDAERFSGSPSVYQPDDPPGDPSPRHRPSAAAKIAAEPTKPRKESP